ncbi:hypothetical protein TNCV_3045861 [Trichonephila clavipes]|uniref:Uncharacterized protein n=1 Tax=Trichonephila clavipes TaxID=2585209 RepID=A0A8X6RLU4_TRICX|nr:hypothetical protein TNCV_3045861 [Trichonephila clavipes]
MSTETLIVLNRKRGAIKAKLTRIKDFINNPEEKDEKYLESKLYTLKSLRIKLEKNRFALSNQIFFKILNKGKIKLADGKLILQDTIFGYVASGVMSHNYTNKSYCGLVSNANEFNNSIVNAFWEIENCPDFEISTVSREEKLCEE